jgi:hypothetical protein
VSRGVSRTAIDLGLVEEGIEIGKKMMAEMIANYPKNPSSPPARENLNEVSPITARSATD